MDMPSDAQRIERIKWLLEDGNKDKILMSHDIHTKHRLVSIVYFIATVEVLYLLISKIHITIL